MLDKLYITPRQWLRILRWTLYAALFLLALLVQTVVFGNRTILGARIRSSWPLSSPASAARWPGAAAATFALIASLVWCLSGIDQGSVCLLVLTVLPVLAASCAAPCWQTAFCRRCSSALSRLPWSRASSS